MKKFALICCACALCCGLFGCNKEEKVTTANVASEQVVQIEVKWQLESQDKDAVAAGQNLECRYALITNNKGTLSRKELSSKGTKCIWADLKGDAKKGSDIPAANFGKINDIVIAGSSVEKVDPQRDCAAINVSTTAGRKFGFLDCTLANPSKSVSGDEATAKNLRGLLGGL